MNLLSFRVHQNRSGALAHRSDTLLREHQLAMFQAPTPVQILRAGRKLGHSASPRLGLRRQSNFTADRYLDCILTNFVTKHSSNLKLSDQISLNKIDNSFENERWINFLQPWISPARGLAVHPRVGHSSPPLSWPTFANVKFVINDWKIKNN